MVEVEREIGKVEMVHLSPGPGGVGVVGTAVSSPLFHSTVVVFEVPAPSAFRADRSREQCIFENHTETSSL